MDTNTIQKSGPSYVVRLLQAVRATNWSGIVCDDVDGQNWFDAARNYIHELSTPPAGARDAVTALPALWRTRAARMRTMGLSSEAEVNEAKADELEAALTGKADGWGAIIPCRCPAGTRTQELCMDKRVCSAVYALQATQPAATGAGE